MTDLRLLARTAIRTLTQLRALKMLALLGMLHASDALCASPTPWRLDHYRHTAFSVDQGAPSEVSSMAQTSDGYLWVGGAQGLAKFDGLKFTRFVPAEGERLLSSQVMALLPARDGGLWVGYEANGASLLKDGHLTHYTTSKGYDINLTYRIFEGYSGRIYALGSGRLLALEKDKWIHATPLPSASPVNAATIDGRGILWLATNDEIQWCKEYDCQPQAAGFKLTHLVLGLSVSPTNILYVGQDNGPTRRFRIEGTRLVELSELPVSTVAPVFDRHGGVWLPSLGAGMMRLSPRAGTQSPDSNDFITETFKKTDGLTGDFVWPALVDTEGDVWTGTQEGVDRFREASLVNVSAPAGLQSPKVVPAANGKAWVASSLPLMQWDGSSLRPTKLGPYAFAMCTDSSSGKTWLVYDDGLWELTEDGLKHVAPIAPDAAKSRAYLLGCRRDGSLLSLQRRPAGGFEWVNGKWIRQPAADYANMILATSDGKFLLGHRSNRLLVLDGESQKEYGTADGLDIGVIKAAVTLGDVVVLGGRGGLASFKDGRFQSLVVAGKKHFAEITGLAIDDAGALWVHMPDGAARIDADEIAVALKNPSHAMNYFWLGHIDGMSGVPAQDVPSPSLSKGSDGRLWFTSQSGITWLDPGDIVVNQVVPKLKIDGLIADGTRYPTNQSPLSVPPRPSTVKVEFNAPLLRAAEGARFTYRLDGVDKDWQEAGSSREAQYSNLGPGDHTFRVRAANESGVWSNSEANLVFHIQPAFYETWWFRTLCGLLILFAMCIGYVIHIRRVTEKLRIREDERVRIARDLHDTLLQSVQAMLVRVETIKDRTTDAWAKAEAERVADWGRQAVSEGRTKVGKLRAALDESASPIRDAVELLENLSEASGLTLHASLAGTERPLRASAAQEVASAVREVVTNALSHSNGRNVWLSITYGDADFVAVIKDDGCGIDEAALAASTRSGHWGLKGVQERIFELGGTFTINSACPVGTEVTMCVPARSLYKRSTAASRA
ncbi:sensor histidine kinase [Dyella sp. C11]|uniref:sensor histidine kinase n=1 Tax=Dyella sp. C11 TaxID=2126991 RepID=UPI0018E53A10|nr:sensor histidine kinase [Dyella sp. C11]